MRFNNYVARIGSAQAAESLNRIGLAAGVAGLTHLFAARALVDLIAVGRSDQVQLKLRCSCSVARFRFWSARSGGCAGAPAIA